MIDSRTNALHHAQLALSPSAAVERTPITSTRWLAYRPVVVSVPTSAWTLGLIFEL